MTLTDKQKKAFEKLWFIYGNSGKKCTPLNHKLVQRFVEHNEYRRSAYRDSSKHMTERFGQAFADKNGITQECLDAIENVFKNP